MARLKKTAARVIKKAIKAKPKTKKKVSAIPKGYHSITPYLITHNAGKAIEFYKKIFGAKELFRMKTSQGKIAHAEIKIGNSHIMLADEFPEMQVHSPKSYGGSPVGILLYTENVDKIIKKAVSAGAKIIKEVQDMFYGDRSGTVEDPYGHKWTVSTHIEDVSNAELKKRVSKLFGK
jgi:PhnB protein